MNDEIRMTSGGNDECRMSNDELPNGWLRVPFSAVTVNPVQRVPSEKEQITYIDIGSVDRITKQVVEPQTMLGKDAPSRARKVIQTGDVLVSTVRPNLNAVALVESQYNGQFASTGFDVLRSPFVDPRWLFYSVRTPEFLDRMSELVQGALYPAVRSFDIRSFVIPLAPLPEQKRIADKLDAVLTRVDACRARLDRVPALLKRFRQSVLHAATSGRLTAEWRMSNGVNDEWENIELADAADDFSYGTSAKSSKTGKVAVLRMGNIQDGKLDWEGLVYTSDVSEISKYRLTKGDVLFNRTNSPELVGKTCVFDGKHEAIHAGYLIRVKCSERLIPEFLNYCLNSPDGKDYCWQVKTDGVSQSNINAKKLAALPMLLPPLPEQQEIVRRVEALFAIADRIEARLAVAQKTVGRLTPSVLAKAFRGELVPQDPSDEPTSVLLDRIRHNPTTRTMKPARGRHAKTA